MGGRDHSCEGCGRGGFNDPEGECICAAASALADTCPTCGTPVRTATGDEGTSHYEPIAEEKLQKLASAVKVWRNATEDRLRLLAASARHPELSDLMIKPDRDLCEALEEVEAG
jgi:hypothetical protein